MTRQNKSNPFSQKKISIHSANSRNFLTFVSLSPLQEAHIPSEKQRVFLELMKKLFLEIEDVVANLSMFILEDGFGENTETLVGLSQISRVKFLWIFLEISWRN